MGPITPHTDSDEALVARAKRDRDAFGCLYDRYVEQVYQFAYRRVKNHTIMEEQFAARQAGDVLWQTVSTLPMAEQQVLVYRFARDMSVRDIATTMGRTEGAVKQLLFRAVKRLRQRLQQIGFADEP